MGRHDGSFGRWEFVMLHRTGPVKRDTHYRLQHTGSLLALDQEHPILPRDIVLAEDLSGFQIVNDQCNVSNDWGRDRSFGDDIVQRIRDEMPSNDTNSCPHLRSWSRRLHHVLEMNFAR